jgi:hypothetical protein
MDWGSMGNDSWGVGVSIVSWGDIGSWGVSITIMSWGSISGLSIWVGIVSMVVLDYGVCGIRVSGMS